MGPCRKQLLRGDQVSPPVCGFLTVFWLFSLKLECDKLASEKSEMQRHYVMVRTGPGSRGQGGSSGEQVPVPGSCPAGSLRPVEAKLALASLKAGLFSILCYLHEVDCWT